MPIPLLCDRLRRQCEKSNRCHGLVTWSLTFVATKKRQEDLRMPRPCAVEPHVRCYKGTSERICGCHALRMPRPCAVEPHVRCYKETSGGFADATALCRGASRSLLQRNVRRICGCAAFFVAASVRLHGARPWHLEERERVCVCFL